jgi:formylglycine-generating enzyme required for sulfatase activity
MNQLRISTLALVTVAGGLAVACSGKTTPDPQTPDYPVQQPMQPGAPMAAATVTGTGDAGMPLMPRILSPNPCLDDTGEHQTQQPYSMCLAEKKYGGRAGADSSCGPNGDEDCGKYDAIPGGTFNRFNDSMYPATVPNFKLGRFLVTVGRFNIFLAEGAGTKKNPPPYSTSANPSGQVPELGAATGWKTGWAQHLQGSVSDVQALVASDPASPTTGCTIDRFGPNHPITCIDRYLANAFCAWDGGYLPTEAQWEYAVRGGSEQRKYAWGDADPDLKHSNHCLAGGGDANVDVYCNNPTNPEPEPVGAHAEGQAKWGTYDLQGNVFNALQDDSGDPPHGWLAPPTSCTNNCATHPPDGATWSSLGYMTRGIAYVYPNSINGPKPVVYGATWDNIINGRPFSARNTRTPEVIGFRCAYPNEWP